MVDLVGTALPLLYGACALACPLGMGAMMWFMMRGGRNNQSPDAQTPTQGTTDAQEEIHRLRAEVDGLRAARADRDPHPAADAHQT